MRNYLGILFMSVFIVCTMFKLGFSQATDSLVITSYYPSPMGVYSELRLVPKGGASALCSSTTEGLFFYDSNTRQLLICRLNTTTTLYEWGTVVQSIQATATITDVNGNVNINGDLNVNGAISANGDLNVVGTKNFKINHPIKSGVKLIHSSLEGPEAAVFYRGQATLSNGKATVKLPEYFEALTRKENRTVLLTPLFELDEPISELAVSRVKDGRFLVRSVDNSNSSQQFYWEVKAVRADIEPLKVETAE